MTDRWFEALRADKVLLNDGATGTELRRRGVMLDDDAWSGPATLTHTELLTAIHADYLRAGADIITTNTFGTNRFVLDAAGLGPQFRAVNRTAVEAVRRAFDASGTEAAIAGSLSCLPPRFDPEAYPAPAIEAAAYEELATLLAESGVDYLALEMMEDVEHASRACEAIRGVGLPFWLGISTRLGADGRTLFAYDFPHIQLSTIIDALIGYEPVVVNIMHTPADAITASLRLLEPRWDGVIGACPEVDVHSDPNKDPQALAAFVESAHQWWQAGARVLGGCCGTTPAHIEALDRARSTWPRNSAR